jgi:Predicted membrane protein
MMYGRGYNLFNNCFGFGAGYVNHGIGMILMIAIILITVAAFVLIFSRINKRKPGNDVLEALKIRLAKGEISEDEYNRRKNIID